MTLKAENRLHFGVPIFESAIPGLDSQKDSLMQALANLRGVDSEGVSRSNNRGWHSKDDLHQSSDPAIQWITEQIYQLGNQMIRHAEKCPPESQIFLTSLWANINDFGAWNAPHAHLPCEWSGCVYIDVNENPEPSGNGIHDGDIMFFDPVPAGYPYRPASTVSYTPKNGTLYLFPGYLMHMVAPHYDDRPRISMAFNFRLGDVVNQLAR